ncbi:MAG: Asp-tRNA(Asn)/Glu-tRNA(Gln) amidotransferase subunit GatA [Verrucomicrobiales bacterium]|nr:Asp-tRNA(Asn)/Glu-tRNA(Gln) amidotransferase subunit GatA [Verrucomicrobiales bacterium]
MPSLNELSLTDLRDLLARGECSSREVVEACLDRVDAVEAQVRAFLHLDREGALRQADAADAARRAGEASDRPLLGLPLGLKDVLAEQGQQLTCGSRILADFISPYDATVVERLRQAGAVLFGRLNMDEFAMGSSTENSAYFPTRNPWDLDRTPGGSSGGCAAAVAAAECPASIGSDTGGSVRQPAAFCGVVGLKPTYGRVSRYGLVAYASSLDQVGPVTRSVSDAALLLGVMAGHDSRDATSLPDPAPDYAAALDRGVRGLRIGLPREYRVGGLAPEVGGAVEAAVKVLADLGAEVREISLPHTEHSVAAYYIIAPAEASANLARFDGIRYGRREDGPDPVTLYARTRGSGFGREVKRRIVLGTYVLSSGYYDAYYLRAQKVRALIRRDFLRAFEEVDLILTPTTPTTAFRLGEKVDDPLQMYLMDVFTLACNLAGLCGISLPCGFSGSPRLPIGLQLLGPPLGETVLLQAAHAYQSATAWHRELPGLATAPGGSEPASG